MITMRIWNGINQSADEKSKYLSDTANSPSHAMWLISGCIKPHIALLNAPETLTSNTHRRNT